MCGEQTCSRASSLSSRRRGFDLALQAVHGKVRAAQSISSADSLALSWDRTTGKMAACCPYGHGLQAQNLVVEQ